MRRWRRFAAAVYLTVGLLVCVSAASGAQTSGHVTFTPAAWERVTSEYQPDHEQLYCLVRWHKVVRPDGDTIAVIDSLKRIAIGDRLSVPAEAHCTTPSLHTHPPEYPNPDPPDMYLHLQSGQPFFCVFSNGQLVAWPADPFPRK